MYGAHVKKKHQYQSSTQRVSQEQQVRQQQARVRDGRDRRDCTSIMFERATQFISNSANSSVPFMLYLSPLSPHPPFIYPPAYDAMFDSIPSSINTIRRKVCVLCIYVAPCDVKVAHHLLIVLCWCFRY
jgi:hypothetical protein